MTRVVRNAALFCVAGILVASAAVAGVPDPGHTTLAGPYVNVVGYNNGGTGTLCPAATLCPDANGAYTGTVRDFAGNPVGNATIVVDFSACTPDFRVSCTQLLGGSNLPGLKVQTTGDGAGNFTIYDIGAAAGVPATYPCVTPPCDPGPGVVAGTACVAVYANGVLVGNLVPAAFDANASGGVTPADLSNFIKDLLNLTGGATSISRAREDYIHTGASLNKLDAADLSAAVNIGTRSAGGVGSGNTGSYCP